MSLDFARDRDAKWKALVRARLAPLHTMRLDPTREAEIVAELAQHVAQHHAELRAAGVPDEEAERLALAPLDDPERIAREIARADRPAFAPPEGRELRRGKPQCTPPPPAASGAPWSHVLRDVRYAVRMLRRSPGFAATAILTLSLGIGANVAIFSVVRAVILRPPPYREASRVVAFLNSRSSAPGSIASSAFPDYLDWQRQLTSFEQIGLLSGWTFNISGLELPERVFGARVTGSLFPLLGTPPLLGRTIEPSDDRPGGAEVLVLGYRVWQRLFAGDPQIIGRVVMTEGRPHTVIGVMPPRFRFPTDDIEMWAAIKENMTGMPRNSRFMTVVGRLKPGVAPAAAQAELDTVTAQLESAYPETNQGWRVRLAGVHDAVVGNTKPALLALVGAVGLVLIIACANVSNLLLARATSRRRETAVRLAIGASRSRLVAQWLIENLVLSTVGGLGGIALAYGAVQLVVAFGPSDVPRLDETAIDVTILAFTCVTALVAGAIPALAPAVRSLRVAPQAALKDGFGSYAAAAAGRSGALLIVGEVALAMTLAVAGALLLQSFLRLTAVKPGFDPQGVLSLKVFLTPPRYGTVASGKQYIRQALDRMAAVGGVESVAAISQLPMGDPSSGQRFDIDGRPVSKIDRPMGAYRAVSPSYFATLRIPLVRGRLFSDADREDTPGVVVINDAMARRLWANQDPIGQRIRWATDIPQFDQRLHTIVGVVADVKSSGLDRSEPPAIYAPYTQRVFPWMRWTSFVVRTHGDPESYTRPLKEAMATVDPLQPVFQVATLETVISQSVATRRFHTGLIDLFAALALALCSIGVYGTIGYWVADRAREIGVRMALGARPGAIRRMVVGRACALTAIGIVIGVFLSAATSRFLSTLLFDVRPLDVSAIAAVSALVLGTGAAAAYIPARRAAGVDPLTVIRGE